MWVRVPQLVLIGLIGGLTRLRLRLRPRLRIFDATPWSASGRSLKEIPRAARPVNVV